MNTPLFAAISGLSYFYTTSHNLASKLKFPISLPSGCFKRFLPFSSF
jgi:hypothetical protein